MTSGVTVADARQVLGEELAEQIRARAATAPVMSPALRRHVAALLTSPEPAVETDQAA